MSEPFSRKHSRRAFPGRYMLLAVIGLSLTSCGKEETGDTVSPAVPAAAEPVPPAPKETPPPVVSVTPAQPPAAAPVSVKSPDAVPATKAPAIARGTATPPAAPRLPAGKPAASAEPEKTGPLTVEIAKKAKGVYLDQFIAKWGRPVSFGTATRTAGRFPKSEPPFVAEYPGVTIWFDPRGRVMHADVAAE